MGTNLDPHLEIEGALLNEEHRIDDCIIFITKFQKQTNMK